MNIFDILGPVMVGPSSSHTAGAVRIGLAAKKLLGAVPVKARITLSGSFAATGVGHGTDRAIIAGLLGMDTDDTQIPNSFDIAREQGLVFSFVNQEIRDAHPNTALLEVISRSGRELAVQASSLGGGRIMINKLDGTQIDVTGERPALIVHNEDEPGQIAKVATLLAGEQINVATMNLYRDKRGGYAVMVIEVDQNIPDHLVKFLERSEGIVKVTCLNIGE